MNREEAYQKISALKGQDLRSLANRFGVTVWKGGKINKGWAGHVIERYLGLPLNASRSPNFGSWELKVIPLKRKADGTLAVKETMAITMIDPWEVIAKDFEQSHLYHKLRKMIVVARIFESQQELSSLVYNVAEFDLENPNIYQLVKADYELVRECLRTRGFQALTGAMGKLIQPRTKGPGHGSSTRAFYARTQFVAHIIGLSQHPLLVP
jgi:DNA mismatch repair protein MutH